MAHARRKFHDAIDERPKAANVVLRVIAKLYKLSMTNQDELTPLTPAAWPPS